MDISRFCLEVEGFQRRTGKTQEEVSEAFGVSLAYLRNVLYKSKPLTIHLVEKAAPVLGLTIHDFILGDSAPQSEELRDDSFGNIMGILGKNLSDAQKKAMIEMAKAAQLVGREREAAEKKEESRTFIQMGMGSGKTSANVMMLFVTKGLRTPSAKWVVKTDGKHLDVSEVVTGPKGQELTRPIHPDPEETRQLLEIWEKEKLKLMQQQDEQAEREGLSPVLVGARTGGHLAESSREQQIAREVGTTMLSADLKAEAKTRAAQDAAERRQRRASAEDGRVADPKGMGRAKAPERLAPRGASVSLPKKVKGGGKA